MEASWPPPSLPDTFRIHGVVYRVPGWLDVGTSFFIPSLDHQYTLTVLRMHYSPLNIRLGWHERIESGVLGIRVWRVV